MRESQSGVGARESGLEGVGGTAGIHRIHSVTGVGPITVRDPLGFSAGAPRECLIVLRDDLDRSHAVITSAVAAVTARIGLAGSTAAECVFHPRRRFENARLLQRLVLRGTVLRGTSRRTAGRIVGRICIHAASGIAGSLHARYRVSRSDLGRSGPSSRLRAEAEFGSPRDRSV